jgi:hypothetical protein
MFRKRQTYTVKTDKKNLTQINHIHTHEQKHTKHTNHTRGKTLGHQLMCPTCIAQYTTMQGDIACRDQVSANGKEGWRRTLFGWRRTQSLAQTRDPARLPLHSHAHCSTHLTHKPAKNTDERMRISTKHTYTHTCTMRTHAHKNAHSVDTHIHHARRHTHIHAYIAQPHAHGHASTHTRQHLADTHANTRHVHTPLQQTRACTSQATTHMRVVINHVHM